MKHASIGAVLLLSAVASCAQVSSAPSASASCSQDVVIAAAKQVDSSRAVLLALPTGDGLQTDVSPAAQQAIASMKRALGEFVNEYMRCISEQPGATKIQNDISGLVHTFRLPPGSHSNEQLPPDFGKYGFELSFDVRATQNPKLVAITADFSIECGGDTMLFIFAPQGDSWREVLRWQTKPYDTVGGGTMAFDYGISPVDESGHWYAVIHNVAPWCSSTWSSISYQALKPTADPLHPHVLLSNSDSIWWGNDDYGEVKVEKSQFDLRFHSSSIDTGVHSRVFIRHYAVSGDTVRRTQPVAVSPRDFVDEWLESPWKTAAGWSSESASGALREAHRAFSRRNQATNPLYEFNSVYKCSGSHVRHQVELVESTGKDFKTESSFYYQVVGDGTYTMMRVSKTPDPSCRGDNLLEGITAK